MRKGITINGTKIPPANLEGFCRQVLSNTSLSAWERNIYEFLLQWKGPDDHMVVHTSGSTGTPKSIRLQKSWMEYSARQTCRFFDLNEESSALLCLPAAYIAGKMMIVRAIVAGFNLVLREPSGAPFADPGERLDFAAVTPMQLFQSLDFLQQNPVVRTLIVGGGEISKTLEEQVQRLPAEVYSTYGMTETSSHIALRRVNGSQRQDHFTVIGHTRISTDSRGCLAIENPELFNGQLITNDLVELLSENRFRWLGRFDNIINTGGIKVIPEEVEQRLSHLIQHQIAITAVPDEKLGEMIVLVVEGKEVTWNEKEQLLSSAKDILPPYAVPRKIISIGTLPRTPNGKTDRRSLKQSATKNLYH
jgi:O-succinylbenzoic acid--CoA ligase